MALPNRWGLYNLRSSPFFQATLRADSDATLLRLFVGRQRERQLLLATIGSSGSSRQAVADRPGIGKTTLVQTVKADAQAEGYWSSDAIIPISAEGASEQLLGQLLSGVYDASEPRRSCQAGTQANSNVLQQRPTCRRSPFDRRRQMGSTVDLAAVPDLEHQDHHSPSWMSQITRSSPTR